MVPTESQAKALWETYHLPTAKQRHVTLVAHLSQILADMMEECTGVRIQKDLLCAGALLHDIDKNVPLLPGEQHPDAAVRILTECDMREVAALVKTHPLHAILDERISPKTWEEKVLFLADKMTKYNVITVDERFALWNEEHLPSGQQKILDLAYPKVKQLEHEVFQLIRTTPEEVIKVVKHGILQ